MEEKAKKIFYGILAVFTFSLILSACPADSGTPPPDRSKLKLSGQVYIQNTDPLALLFNSKNEEYKKNLDISDGGLGGTGEIKNGKLNYSINVVPQLSPINEGGGLDSLKEIYPSLKFSPENVNATAVVLLTDSDEYSGLLKYLLEVNFDLSKLAIKITIKMVNYMYVDKNLNITADVFNYDYTNPELPFPITLTSEKINLSLKQGWNTLYSEITAQANIPLELIPVIMGQGQLDPDSPGPDLSALEPKGNLKMSVGDPGNLNWTLIPQPSDDDDPEYPQPPQPPQAPEPF
ncbi:MAG: hypothetical protein LBC52_05500 [Treponema sp.]|jgi:hypothetical protein|nr:hypothetical protein [Treponema sp.]